MVTKIDTCFGVLLSIDEDNESVTIENNLSRDTYTINGLVHNPAIKPRRSEDEDKSEVTTKQRIS